jgi:hypothetical protein
LEREGRERGKGEGRERGEREGKEERRNSSEARETREGNLE